MARRRRDTPPELFTSAELASAAGLTVRNALYLGAKGLLPEAEQDDIEGSANLYDIRALHRVTIIGALHAGGAELVLAARLGNAVVQGMEQTYGYIHSQLKEFDPSGRVFLSARDHDARNDYWYHQALCRAGVYRPATTHSNDVVIEIVNRRYVFVRPLGGPPPATPNQDAEFWITGWERGSEATLQTVFAAVDQNGGWGTPEGDAAWKKVREEFGNARKNALATLQINASLAIRTGLDRLAEHRGNA